MMNYILTNLKSHAVCLWWLFKILICLQRCLYIVFFISCRFVKDGQEIVSVEKSPCFWGAGLKRFKSKVGRGFLKCQAETCTLFVPEEKYTHLMVGYKTKVNKIFKSNNFPYVVAMKWRVCGYLIPLPTRTGRISGARIRRRRDFLSVRQWKLGSEESKEKSEENRTGFYCKYEA